MNLYDFITQDELDDLPEDNRRAFAVAVTHAQGRLRKYIEGLGDDSQWAYQDAHNSFANVMIAIARVYEIEPFARMDVPLQGRFDYDASRQFSADLDHYVTQILVEGSRRRSRNSIAMPSEVKKSIRTYVSGLKQAIDGSNLSESKRSALQAKLAAFETELEKPRLSLLAVATISLAVAAVPGSLWASSQVVAKLTSDLLHVIGEAKAVDDESRALPAGDKPVALLPPRRRKADDVPPARSYADELDDEIPF